MSEKTQMTIASALLLELQSCKRTIGKKIVGQKATKNLNAKFSMLQVHDDQLSLLQLQSSHCVLEQFAAKKFSAKVS